MATEVFILWVGLVLLAALSIVSWWLLGYVSGKVASLHERIDELEHRDESMRRR